MCIHIYIFIIDAKYVNNINQSTFVEDVIFLQRKNGVYVWMDVLVNFIKIQINI